MVASFFPFKKWKNNPLHTGDPRAPSLSHAANGDRPLHTDSMQPSLWGGASAPGAQHKPPSKPAKEHRPDREETGMFPIWPFRLAVLGVGLTLFTISLALKFTVYRDPLPTVETCYTASQLTVNGIQIDFCAVRTATTGGTQCGQPAADLWCKRNGQRYSTTFVPSSNVSNTITLGNNAFGGQQSFESICCDAQSYWPTAPRWLLWTSGLLLLYLVAVAITKLLLLSVEVLLVGLVATEALYFFYGFEPILKHVTYSVGLVIWTHEVFWVIWCGNDSKECDDRWLQDAQILMNVAECIMACQLGRLAALTLGKTFGLMYFFANQLPQVRRVLNQERYLAAMSTPHWARALIHAQEAAAAEADAVRARGDHSLVVGGNGSLQGPAVPKFHGGSVLKYLKQDKQLLDTLPGPLGRMVLRMLSPGSWLSCCKGHGKCRGGACASCCPSGCFSTCVKHDDDDDSWRATTDGGFTVNGAAATSNGVSNGISNNLARAPAEKHGMVDIGADRHTGDAQFAPLPTTLALRAGGPPLPPAIGASGAGALHTCRSLRTRFPAIPEARSMRVPLDVDTNSELTTPPGSPFAASAAAPPALHARALFRNATMAARPAGPGGAEIPPSVDEARQAALLRFQSLRRQPVGAGAHHSDLAGVLEMGGRPAPASAGSGDLDHKRLEGALESGQEARLERRSLPVFGTQDERQAAAEYLHQRALELQADKEAVHAHQEQMKKMAADLNRELVAVDVGGAGALRKFTLFLRKYQTMSDDQLEKETRSLATRLFNNLKAYLDQDVWHQGPTGPYRHHSYQLPHRKFPSQESLPAFAKEYGAGLNGGAATVMDGLGSERPTYGPSSERPSAAVPLPRAGAFKLPHVSSSPALCYTGPSDGAADTGGGSGNGADGEPQEPEAEAITFTDFVAAVRRARRTLSRTSTGSLSHAAKEAWSMFDKTHSSKLTEEDVRLTLFEVYKSRRNLALSIKANQAVCRSLQAAASFVIQTALVFVYMAIFGLAVAFSSGLDFFKTYVLAFSFIFGDSVKALFQSAIYLFAEHPFDVGDMLKMGENTWQVEQFDLMFTVLVSGAGEWATVSNTALINSQLINLSRSKAKGEMLKIKVPANMPLDVLPVVKAAMKKVYEATPSEYVETSIGCSVAEMETSQSLVLGAKWQYTFPPSEPGRMGKAKGAMQDAVIQTLLEQGVPAIPLQLDFNILALKTKKD